MKNSKNFIVINLGCRVNKFESIAITDLMIKAGYNLVKNFSSASIFIINTCTVTSRADRKCRNFINKINHLKNKDVLVVIGCYSQINPQYVSLNAEITVGNKFKSIIPRLIDEYYNNHQKIIKVQPLTDPEGFEEFPIYSFCENTRAVIKIQDGCNFMCSYCLIPYARGVQRSFNHIKILNTIKKLVNLGFYEIILTGVNTAGYKDQDYSFYDLLKDIDNMEGNFRVRISSIEPFQINYQIIDLITNNTSRWVQEFHLCLQSANNDVLKAMKRKYTIQEFTNLCNYIRSKNPFCSITTDYIVGFNTENEARFNDSLNNLKKLKLSFMNIFPYSIRKNTIASYSQDLVDEKTKFKRTKIITDLANKITHEYLKHFIGKTLIVYFENPKYKNIQVGHSQYYFKVFIKTHQDLASKVKQVKVINVLSNNQVFGILV